MVADGKENLHPSSPLILHDSSVANSVATKSKQQTVLGKSSTLFNQAASKASRPLLFSEILFNDISNGHFSTSCASPIPNTFSSSDLDFGIEQPMKMNGLFNASFNAPTTNVFGAIGSQAPLLSSSSSTTSTNSDQMDTLLWLGAIGNALPSTKPPLPSYSPPSNEEFNSAAMPFMPESQCFGNVCGNCEGLTPENLCFDCSDSLCNRCVILHLSHFPYKHHTIQKISTTSPPANGRLGNNFPASPPRNKIESDNQCDMHFEVMRYVCEHCKIIVCQECTLRDHKDHQCTSIDKYVERPQVTIKMLMDKGASGKQQIKQNIDRILQFTQHLDRDANEIIQRTRKNGLRHNVIGNGMRNEEHDRALTDIIEKFRQQKMTNFHDQTSGLRAALAGIASVTDDLKKLSNNLNDLSHFQMAKTLIESDHKIEHFLKQTRKLSPSPVNVNNFLQSIDINGGGGGGGSSNGEESIVAGLQRMMQPNVGHAMAGMTSLPSTSNPMSLLPNNNPSKSIRRPITRNHRTYQNNNQQNLMQASPFNVISGISNWNASLSQPNSDLISFPEASHFNISPPRFVMPVNRVNGDEPRAYGQCIFNSDGPVVAVQRMKPSHSFAYDGSLEGQLSRPWGVCVDKDGNIIIGDRRNNRIQIFYPNGQFKFQFGSKGSGDGELELPAGVTTDRQNRIIVADKDNHRIQIFSSTGRFILKFGGYGRDLGEFQYPWDVAVNSIGNIIATDTRNHRIQMFTSNGHFITKYSFDSAYYEKHLKSHITPRGLCFTPSGDILVTDFENHRIMKLDGNLTTVKMVRGREGEGEVHEFNRPSGLCCDDNGRVVVADSKNQRVLVYNTNIELQWVLDVRRTLSALNNEKDRPSDVAILPDGRIVVLFETSPDTKDCPHPMKTFVQIY